MNAEQFCYWLNGALELGHQVSFDHRQVQVIQDHLNLVFKKETPVRTTPILDKSRFNPSPVLGPFPEPFNGFGLGQPPVFTC